MLLQHLGKLEVFASVYKSCMRISTTSACNMEESVGMMNLSAVMFVQLL